jgi:hypothetical protein
MTHSIIFYYGPFSLSVTSNDIGFRQELNVQIIVLNFVF